MGYPYNFNQFNPNMPYQAQYPTQVQQQINQPPQIQNGGFFSVSSEEQARVYPLAPGTSITFKDENAPYIYTKTMGFSQLDRPIFEKFRLVREEEAAKPEKKEPKETKSKDIEELKEHIDCIWEEIRLIRSEREEAAVDE